MVGLQLAAFYTLNSEDTWLNHSFMCLAYFKEAEFLNDSKTKKVGKTWYFDKKNLPCMAMKCEKI